MNQAAVQNGIRADKCAERMLDGRSREDIGRPLEKRLEFEKIIVVPARMGVSCKGLPERSAVSYRADCTSRAL